MHRIAVIGLGPIGAIHASILNSLPDCKVVCLADSEPRLSKVLRKIAPNYGVYTDLQEMVACETFEVAYVCTPIMAHEPVIRELVESRSLKAVFVEKPLAADHNTGLKMAAEVEANNLDSVVGFQKRHIPSFGSARKLLQSGLLGQPTEFEAHHFTAGVLEGGAGWRFESATGGVILDWGAHLVDLLSWFFGSPSRISTTRQRLFSDAVEDSVKSEWFYPHGLHGVLEISWSRPDFKNAELLILVKCTGGWLRATESTLQSSLGSGSFRSCWFQEEEGKITAQTVPFLLGQPENTMQDGYFMKCLTEGVKPGPSIMDSLPAQAILDQMRQVPLE